MVRQWETVVSEGVPGQRFPAMVLVHGGGVTAFAHWVRLWNQRGYAAIALDTGGNIPTADNEDADSGKPHAYPGPAKSTVFSAVDEPPRHQWPYHAVSAIIKAHNLIRSFPGVENDKIGITGISWGGYLALLAAAADHRFQCVIPVYGCGYLQVETAWTGELQKMAQRGNRWTALWDPALYLKRIKKPVLWVTGTNDPYYSMASLMASYRQIKKQSFLCIRPNLIHSHKHGWKSLEIYAFADSILKEDKKLPRILEQGRRPDGAWVRYQSDEPVERAFLMVTFDTGKWKNRRWKRIKARVVPVEHIAYAVVPVNTTAYYFILIDKRRRMISAPPIQ